MINMVPEGVLEKVEQLTKEIETFHELSNDYSETSKKLSSWRSPNKDALEEQIKNAQPAFDKALEVITSYRDVAAQAVRLVSDAEREIREKLMA